VNTLIENYYLLRIEIENYAAPAITLNRMNPFATAAVNLHRIIELSSSANSTSEGKQRENK
jgi:hypothetical protein